MSGSYDVIVAGAGCAGALVSARIAAGGYNVLLLDRSRPDELMGVSRDLVEVEALARADIRESDVGADAGFRALEIVSPDTATRLTLKQIPFTLVDRGALSRTLIKRARDAGVHVVSPCAVAGAEIQNGFVTGVVTDRGTFDSRLCIGATGLDRVLCREMPAGMGIPRRIMTSDHISIYRETRDVSGEASPEEGVYRYHVGLFGGYAWTYTAGGTIDIGAGVQDRPGTPDPRELVLGYIRSHPEIGQVVLGRSGGRIPTRRPLSNMVTNGLMTVGDSACQAMPIIARGVGGALIGASMAAETALGALETGEASTAALWSYNSRYMEARGSHQAALDCLRLLFQAMPGKDFCWSMAHGVIDDQEVASALSGRFAVPSALAKVRSLLRGLSDVGLLLRYESALKLAQRVLQHYEDYPEEYQAPEFRRWAEEADFLFEDAVRFQ